MTLQWSFNVKIHDLKIIKVLRQVNTDCKGPDFIVL